MYKFEWEMHPNLNPLYFTLHTNKELPKISKYYYGENPGFLVKTFSDHLFKIHGVEEISSYKKYSLSVLIGKVFNNQEDISRIKAEIEAIVAAYFDVDPDEKDGV